MSSVRDLLIPFSYSFRLLKPAVGWFSAHLSCSGCWVMGMKMIMVMINIWDRGLSFWSFAFAYLHFSDERNQDSYYDQTFLNVPSSQQPYFFILFVCFGFICQPLGVSVDQKWRLDDTFIFNMTCSEIPCGLMMEKCMITISCTLQHLIIWTLCVSKSWKNWW